MELSQCGMYVHISHDRGASRQASNYITTSKHAVERVPFAGQEKSARELLQRSLQAYTDIKVTSSLWRI
jgi:hypothetical protein